MIIIDSIVEEDRCMLLANELEPITLPNETTKELGPTAQDIFAIFGDPHLLGNGERLQFLPHGCLHKTFDLELIENVLTNYLKPFRKVCVSLSLHPSETCMPAVILKSFSCSQHSKALLLLPPHPSSLLLKTSTLLSHLPPVAPVLFSSYSSNSPPSSRRMPKSSSHYSSNSSVARLTAWPHCLGAHDGDHAQVRLSSIPNFSCTGLASMQRLHIINTDRGLCGHQ